MIAKKYRMKEREVKRAMKRGTPTFGRYFTFVVMPNKYNTTHRFAIVVSNKHTKSSVLRNGFRRACYDQIDSLKDVAKVQKYGQFVDVVLICKKGLKIEKDFLKESDLARDINVNLGKILG